eukprot:gene8071-10934_t
MSKNYSNFIKRKSLQKDYEELQNDTSFPFDKLNIKIVYCETVIISQDIRIADATVEYDIFCWKMEIQSFDSFSDFWKDNSYHMEIKFARQHPYSPPTVYFPVELNPIKLKKHPFIFNGKLHFPYISCDYWSCTNTMKELICEILDLFTVDPEIIQHPTGSYFDRIHDKDLYNLILEFCSIRDILNFSATCKYCLLVANDVDFWANLYYKRCSLPPSIIYGTIHSGPLRVYDSHNVTHFSWQDGKESFIRSYQCESKNKYIPPIESIIASELSALGSLLVKYIPTHSMMDYSPAVDNSFDSINSIFLINRLNGLPVTSPNVYPNNHTIHHHNQPPFTNMDLHLHLNHMGNMNIDNNDNEPVLGPHLNIPNHVTTNLNDETKAMIKYRLLRAIRLLRWFSPKINLIHYYIINNRWSCIPITTIQFLCELTRDVLNMNDGHVFQHKLSNYGEQQLSLMIEQIIYSANKNNFQKSNCENNETIKDNLFYENKFDSLLLDLMNDLFQRSDYHVNNESFQTARLHNEQFEMYDEDPKAIIIGPDIYDILEYLHEINIAFSYWFRKHGINNVVDFKEEKGDWLAAVHEIKSVSYGTSLHHNPMNCDGRLSCVLIRSHATFINNVLNKMDLQLDKLAYSRSTLDNSFMEGNHTTTTNNNNNKWMCHFCTGINQSDNNICNFCKSLNNVRLFIIQKINIDCFKSDAKRVKYNNSNNNNNAGIGSIMNDSMIYKCDVDTIKYHQTDEYQIINIFDILNSSLSNYIHFHTLRSSSYLSSIFTTLTNEEIGQSELASKYLSFHNIQPVELLSPFFKLPIYSSIKSPTNTNLYHTFYRDLLNNELNQELFPIPNYCSLLIMPMPVVSVPVSVMKGYDCLNLVYNCSLGDMTMSFVGYDSCYNEIISGMSSRVAPYRTKSTRLKTILTDNVNELIKSCRMKYDGNMIEIIKSNNKKKKLKSIFMLDNNYNHNNNYNSKNYNNDNFIEVSIRCLWLIHKPGGGVIRYKVPNKILLDDIVRDYCMTMDMEYKKMKPIRIHMIAAINYAL